MLLYEALQVLKTLLVDTLERELSLEIRVPDTAILRHRLPLDLHKRERKLVTLTRLQFHLI
ncbi:hypothetical protein SAMN05444422_11452 [Halobiforma haloterrestris]|uniref:Uncharacterized protein n=1 Tax=Natronobacterium haloterrestre TaxID=148448 RepID=A0A1I1L448_NATHA|nr:hypothetical protein SAMN05444422_11452 [Halobiforma haloterrestris]